MIDFHLEGEVNFPDFFDDSKVELWLTRVAHEYNFDIQMINYIFCDDEYLLQINRQYLDHDYYTDIITFPYSDLSPLEADIFISLDRVIDNAVQLGVSPEEEFTRVLVHGLLHLCGMNDKDEMSMASMRDAEDKAMKLYK